ncbi:MAG: hypothetical protein IEMM0008_0374 [bacterium]|nr:MAG: hypothetical protein IEMM0008_0374 [bacterium]
MKTRVIVDKLPLRSHPVYESRFLEKTYSFGDLVEGSRIIKDTNDYHYLKVEWNSRNGYLPINYLVNTNSSTYLQDLSDKEPMPNNHIKPLPPDFKPDDLIALPYDWTPKGQLLQVTKETFYHLGELYKAAQTSGIDLKIVGAYQSIRELSKEFLVKYEECFMQNVLEKPGCSPYHLGTLIDVTCSEIDDRLHPLFSLTKTYRWLEEHCTEYHFNFTPDHQLLSARKPWQLQFNPQKTCNSKRIKKKPRTNRLKSFKKSLLFSITQYKPNNLKYLFIHDNEHTARKVSRYAIQKYGGTLYEVMNNNKRNLQIVVDSHFIDYDPNRIFTRKGLKEYLTSQNSGHPDHILKKAFNDIRIVRNGLIRALDLHKENFLISIHTNNRSSDLSIHYFQQESFSNQFMVSINKNHPPKNFFYTIIYKDFLFFKNKKYNVVLQKESTICDDGSLSILTARKAINYITLEVQEGHYLFQKKMLDLTVEYARQQTFRWCPTKLLFMND